MRYSSTYRDPYRSGEVHHEVELAILIGAPLKQANEQQVAQGIAGVGVALDLTLRDLQAQFKKQGSPGRKRKVLMAPVRYRGLFRRRNSAIPNRRI
ncbi:hypothetical protein SODG_004421 [Sodalis praecaptivus]